MNPYQEFRRRALDAGIDGETVKILSDAFRDCQEHRWRGQAVEWCGDADLLIQRALETPEAIAAVCTYFFASDGLAYPAGLRELEKATIQLAEQTLAAGWNAEPEQDGGPPYLVKVSDTDSREYLQGPSSPQEVKSSGYGFTSDPDKAWPFPTRKQAEAKARILDRHMRWGIRSSAQSLHASTRTNAS